MTHREVIHGYVVGDDLDIERDITGVDVNDPIVKAWLTIKTTPTQADPGVVQKIITTAAVAGTGQITEDGAEGQGDGTATVIFQLTAANTVTMGAKTYVYDIQVKANSGKISTPERGSITLEAGYTDASS